VDLGGSTSSGEGKTGGPFGSQSHSPCPTGLQTGVNEMRTDGVGSGFGSQCEGKVF